MKSFQSRFMILCGGLILSLLPKISGEVFLKSGLSPREARFGTAVAVDGNTCVVGAPHENNGSGAAYVFSKNGDEWVLKQRLVANIEGIVTRGDYFGSSVSISGDTIVVGAPLEDSGKVGDEIDNSAGGSGAVYVFRLSKGQWLREAYLKAPTPDPSAEFGASIAIHLDRIAVGAWQEDRLGSTIYKGAGAVHVFQRGSQGWGFETKLSAPRPRQYAEFGYAVAVYQNIVVIGAPDDSRWFDDETGVVYLFAKGGGKWELRERFTAGNADRYDRFGESVAFYGNRLAVGATGEDSSGAWPNTMPDTNDARGSGAAYIFTSVGKNWVQEAFLKGTNAGGGGGGFGGSIALRGETIVVGASGDDSGAGGNSGGAFVFKKEGGWIFKGYLQASNQGGGDSFGVSVALSTRAIIIGAPLEDSSSVGANGLPNDLSRDAGAAYLYSNASFFNLPNPRVDRIRVPRSGAFVELIIGSQPGDVFDIYRSASLREGFGAPLFSGLPASLDATSTVFVDTNPIKKGGFYKIVRR